MRTTSENTGPSLRRVYTDLFEELAFHCHAEYADRMADALLGLEDDGKDLVGLVDDHERAVYYSSIGRTLRGYAFDKHGVREADFDTLWRVLSDTASWVDADRDELDWIHPHYRWVLDHEDDRNEWGFQP